MLLVTDTEINFLQHIAQSDKLCFVKNAPPLYYNR